jgi:hypothetical protein
VGGCRAHHVADHAAAGSTWPADCATAVGSCTRLVLIDQPTLTPTSNLTAAGYAAVHQVLICVLTELVAHAHGNRLVHPHMLGFSSPLGINTVTTLR